MRPWSSPAAKTARTSTRCVHVRAPPIRAPPREAPNEPELTTVPDRAQVIVNTAYLKQAAQNAIKYGWAKEKQSPGVQKFMR